MQFALVASGIVFSGSDESLPAVQTPSLLGNLKKAAVDKSDRHLYVLRRARGLAETGRFDSWHAIEIELRFREGFSEALEWLDNARLRTELDSICKKAKSRQLH